MSKISFDNWLIVVPARLASTRLEEKPLQDLKGKPLIIRVVENLSPLIKKGAEVIVACDDKKVLEACQKSGISAVLTDISHKSGTDRCSEVARTKSQTYVLNVQGDEPRISVKDLENLMAEFETKSSSFPMATLAFTSNDKEAFHNPNTCKVVTRSDGKALYFSRSPIPYPREGFTPQSKFKHHIGVYAFTRESIFRFCDLGEGKIENVEKLEQLRALESGLDIWVGVATSLTHGVDTKEDLERVRAFY